MLVIDVAQNKILGELKTGQFPHGLRISPDGRVMARRTAFASVVQPCPDSISSS